MKIVGIAAEYNPFHRGHAHLIERARAADGLGATHVVAVMSGHFTQRGAPAILPKAERVKMALAGGADAVIELPTPWSLSSAEGFARGCVSLLEALGCVDTMLFGSECGDVQKLQKVASLMNGERYGELLRYRLGGGLSYPEAQQKVLEELGGSSLAALLDGANNTLGIEYIRALETIAPATVMRRGAEHDGDIPLDGIASASFVRRLIAAGRLAEAATYLPAACRPILTAAGESGYCPASETAMERALLAHLRRLTAADFAALPSMSEGLENRLYEAARHATSYADLIARAKTKRYPQTRIQRAVWNAFLGITAADVAAPPPYVRVLGVTEKGLDVVRAAREADRLPVITRTAGAEALSDRARRIWDVECKAADVYALSLPTPFACGREQTTGLIKYAPTGI